MELELKGKKALVTGASAGLGAAAAMELAAEGAVVTINSRSKDNLAEAAETIEAATGNKPKRFGLAPNAPGVRLSGLLLRP